MSNDVLTAIRPLRMPATAKSVLYALADVANDTTFQAWPSVATLSAYTCLDERTVQRGLRYLEQHHAIKAIGREHRSTCYLITPQEYSTPERCHTTTPADSHPGIAPPIPRHTATPPPAQSHLYPGTLPPESEGSRIEAERKHARHPINGERHALETSFQEFWSAYPRKVAKPAALRAWMKLTPGDDLLQEIRQDVIDRCRSPDWLKDRGAYIPHPATYLNQRRWEDCLTDLKGQK